MTVTTSAGAATAARAQLETEAVREFGEMVDTFLRRTLRSATDALAAPTLMAAGIPGMTQRGEHDPFAFTNIKKHWYDVVRDLATRRADLVPTDVEQALLASTLPSDAYAAVVETLTTASAEQWSVYKTKRALSAQLIVKEKPGTKATSREHTNYKNRVRRLARSAATANFARRQIATFKEDGHLTKKWVSHHDEHTRLTHLHADGQTVPLDQSFKVGGAILAFPGDPTAPLDETANCRCVLVAGSSPSITAGATISDMTSSTLPFTTMTAADPEECTPCALAAEEQDGAIETEPTATAAPATAEWAGVLGVEGEMTGDGRLIEVGTLAWETPMPLRYVGSDVGAHDGAQVVGRILTVDRMEDGRLWGTGDFDLGSDVGREAYRHVSSDLTNGISMDLDNVAFEVRVASEMVSEANPQIALSDDTEQTDAHETTVTTETDENGRVTVQKIAPDDEVRVTTSGRMRAATIVSIPAFSSAQIHSTTDSPDTEDAPLDDEFAALVDTLSEEAEPSLVEAEGYATEQFKNWVDKAGGLPPYIKRISKHLRKKGMTESHAIATAVNVVKKMCATGDVNFPGKQNVNMGSRAKACAAVARWEAMKASSKATKATTATTFNGDAVAVQSAAEIVEGLMPSLSEEQQEEVAEAEPDNLPNVLEGIASNTDDEEIKGALMEAAGKIRDMLTPPEETEPEPEPVTVTAGATPIDSARPPAAWFENPRLTEATALTVTEDGRVYGHLAAWNTCHTSHTARGQCVLAPKSATGYAYFNTGSVLTDNGTEVSAGRITLGTGHADETLNPTDTMAHYEHTGSVAAFVRAGEDKHGIWVAGATRANLSEERRDLLRATPLSGDWRRIGTNLELVAALAVNVPGFPIPRPKGMVASGHMTSLVATGMVPQQTDDGQPTAASTEGLNGDDIAYLKRMARRAQEQDREQAATLGRRVKASTFAMRVNPLRHKKESH